MITPKEARLLALERKQARIGDILRGLRTDVAGARQGIWDAWSDVKAAGAAPSPPAGPSFPAICPSFPTTMPLLNSLYGGCILTWDGGTHWTGCQTHAIPAGGGCGAVASSAVFYSLAGNNTTANWVLTIGYVDSAGCPVNGATCSSTPNVTGTASQTISCCAAYTFIYSHGSAASPAFGNQDVELTITPFVGNLTPASTIPFTSTGSRYTASGTLTWDGSGWSACVAGISMSAGVCVAVTAAITFKLDLFGKMTMAWIITNTTNCSATSNCASTPGAGQTLHSEQVFPFSSSCPASVTYKTTSGLSAAYLRLGQPSITLTL